MRGTGLRSLSVEGKRDAREGAYGPVLWERCVTNQSMGSRAYIRVGIDGSNIRAGGGVTHLSELLANLNPGPLGIESVSVWAGPSLAGQLPLRAWLRVHRLPLLDRSRRSRAWWQARGLVAHADRGCDVLFVPGGTYLGTFRPFVTMSQNLLPFDAPERRRYGMSSTRLRLRILRTLQGRTFRRSSGVVFVSEKARRVCLTDLGELQVPTCVVPHGVAPAFFAAPRPQRSLDSYSNGDPFRFLYVSIIDFYKHQDRVVRAVGALRREKLPIALDLIGGAYGPALAPLQRAIAEVDPRGEFVRYLGPVAHESLPALYRAADAFTFASTCETFGLILLEAMAGGLPIACSSRAAMPETLGEQGLYFDPDNEEEIVDALRLLATSPAVRSELAVRAFKRACTFTWEAAAIATFGFIVTACAKAGGR